KSIDLDVRSIHDSCPFLCLCSDEGREVLGRATSGLALSLARIAPISLVFIIALISVLSLLTIDVGVPAGARMADQYLAFNFGHPLSTVVGTFGSCRLRASSATASALSFPVSICGSIRPMFSKYIWTCPASKSVTAAAGPL